MLDFLPAPLRGVIASLLLAINTIVCCTPLFVVAIFKLCLPFAAAQRCTDWLMRHIHEAWVSNNKRWMDLLGQTRWQIKGLEGLDYEHSYLVTSNHQSWVDILVLQKVFNRRIPLLRFFLKRQLFWVPLLGLAWWALDFPFMGRYSKREIARNPELGKRDMEATRRACAKFVDIPVSVMNFVEGTRYTPDKHASQASPYRHLLKPKSGGVAFVLDAMGQGLHAIVDVTIAYPGGRPSMMDLMANRVPQVIVQVRQRPIPAELVEGDYQSDRAFRARFQQWMNGVWQDKDTDLDRLLGQRQD